MAACGSTRGTARRPVSDVRPYTSGVSRSSPALSAESSPRCSSPCSPCVVGVAVLAVAADQFVIGAARVALIKNVPSLVVGVVIIGFGTSAPEILVSALAALDDEPDVAVGNIVGSNIANLSLLLGIGALIVPLAVDSRTVRREALMVVGAVRCSASSSRVAASAASKVSSCSSRWPLRCSSSPARRPVTRSDPRRRSSPMRSTTGSASEVGRTVVGLVFTVAAGRLLLWGALDLADRAGLSAGFVGATLVSIGTSLPELVTVIQSARRSETDLIVGNLLGSNLFNALAAGGVVGLIGAPRFDDTSLTTIAATAAVVGRRRGDRVDADGPSCHASGGRPPRPRLRGDRAAPRLTARDPRSGRGHQDDTGTVPPRRPPYGRALGVALPTDESIATDPRTPGVERRPVRPTC